ncbi:hypothetical protein HDE70_002309 [Pedobacter cryoconitis]|nr:hypothetical protein [Pedobacter cryoconitis]
MDDQLQFAGSNPASNLLESHNGIALKGESPPPKTRTFQISIKALQIAFG